MTDVEVVILTTDQLRAMRSAIVDTLPWHETEAELRARAEDWDLNSREVLLLEELDRIDYLLGADLMHASRPGFLSPRAT